MAISRDDRNGHHPHGRPVILGPDARPLRRQIPDGEAHPSGIALPNGFMVLGKFLGGSKEFLTLYDEAMKHSRESAVSMRRDAWLQGILQERRLALYGLNWHLKVQDEKSPEQVRVRDNLQAVIHGIPHLKRIIWWLTDALWYGRYAAQVEWVEERLSESHEKGKKEKPGGRGEPRLGRKGPLRGKPVCLTVQDAWPVIGDVIGVQEDMTPLLYINPGDADKLPGVRNALGATALGMTGLPLRGTWRERFIIHRHLIEPTDPFNPEQAGSIGGIGIRSFVFWSDWLRLEWLSNITTFFNRVGLGLTVWKYPRGNVAALGEARQMALDQSDRANIFLPVDPDGSKGAGSEVERIEVPTGGAEALLKLVEKAETNIERYIVGQEGSSSASSSSGHSNHESSAFMASTKANITRFDAENLAVTLTGTPREPGLVNVIKRYTYPRADFPVWLEFSLESPESQDKLAAAKTLGELGVKIKQSEVLAAAGYSKPVEGDEVVEQPQQGQPGMPGAPPPGGAPPGGAPPPGGPPGAGGNPLEALMGGAGGKPPPGAAPTPPAATGDLLKPLQQKRPGAAIPYARHKHASTHVALPDDLADAVRRLAGKLPKGDLESEGREDDPHVTTLYGIRGTDPQAVADAMKGMGPVTLTLGRIGVFPASESGEGDVVHIGVNSPDLHELNKRLKQALPHVKTFPHYKPHITLARLKPGAGKRWRNRSHSLDGREVTISEVVFSDPDGTQTVIPLKGDDGAGQTPPAPAPSSHARLANVLSRLRQGGHTDLARRVAAQYARGAWDESSHPRGQPENAGEFAPKEGGASGGGAATAEKPAPAPHPGESTYRQLAVSSAPTPAPSKARVQHRHLLKGRGAVKALVKDLFKGDYQAIAGVVGAPDDATVNLEASKDGSALWARVEHPMFDGPMVRVLWRDKGSGEVWMKNDFIEVRKEYRGGAGARIFNQQVEHARRHGVRAITAHCARLDRFGKQVFNGFNTWARVGYNQALAGPGITYEVEEDKGRAAEAARLFGAHTVRDVMSTPQGRQWWAENGFAMTHGIFDLKEGSESLRDLADYQAEKAAERKARANA